jgi:ribose transport system permease protein
MGERRGQRMRSWDVGTAVERFAIPLFLVALIVIFSVDSKTGRTFRSSPNIHNILGNQSVTGLIGLAMIVPLIAGYFDLSCAAIAGVSNVAVASLVVQHGVPLGWAMVLGVAIGVLAGAVNGVLVGVVRLNAFIITLGTYIFLGGLLQLYTKGQTITNGFPLNATLWTSGKWLGIARPFWFLIVVSLLVWFVLTQTPFGRNLAAIGTNETAARLAGLRVDRAVFITYLASGFIAGLAGALLTVQNSGADATTAISFLFAALAAVFLGQTAIDPGRYNVWGTIIGVFFVAVAVDGFILLGAASSVTSVFNGAALVVSVTVSTMLGRARERRAQALQREALHRPPAPSDGATPAVTTRTSAPTGA